MSRKISKHRNRYQKDDDEKKNQRRALRLHLTRAEYVLWQELRKHKLGYKFRRQVSIGAFIVDFYCHELLLIIEVDGWVHDSDFQKKYDEKRQVWLERKGYTMLRFLNDEVLFDRELVIEVIQKNCDALKSR